MKEISPNDWEKEFREFLDAPTLEPPKSISNKVFEAVSNELNPHAWAVFLKLLGITTISGILSLAVCPQFGFGNSFWLMRSFMRFGPHVCSIACGAIFISFGIILSFFLLRPEELRVLRKTRFLQLAVLSGLTLSGFICAGAEVFLAVALFWLLGAVVGGLLTLEVSYRVKFAQPGLASIN